MGLPPRPLKWRGNQPIEHAEVCCATTKKRNPMQGLKTGLPALVCLALLCGLPANGRAADELSTIRAEQEALRDLSMTVHSKEIQERELRRMGSSVDMALELP